MVLSVNRDEMFLTHVLDQINFLKEQFRGLEVENLMEDSLLQRTSLRSFEVIGESLKSISGDFKAGHPEVEWDEIVEFAEGQVNQNPSADWNMLWNFIKLRLPEIEREIKAIQK